MDAERVAVAISGWISDRVGEARAEGVVLGLSGGLDSAVVGALARRALGANALGVIMPCESGEQDADDAAQVARALSLSTILVELDEPYARLLQSLPPGPELARANLKPRLRMAALYFLANSRNCLVAGTGNRCEIAVGYFTKYGDGGADILPIGGLLKREVTALAERLGVPERTVRRKPSAGLWPGQTDEDELGMTYEVLDEIVGAIDAGREPKAPPDLVARVRTLMAASRHKKQMPPVCPIPRD